MEILHPQIESYLEALFKEGDPLHREMEKLAEKKSFRAGNRTIAFPIIGKLVGRVIFLLARIVKAQRVFELGSGFGYSAWWFARAIGQTGELYLTDGSQENLDEARCFLERLAGKPKMHFEKGNALEILDQTQGEFDIIFCDIDKHQYPEAFRRATPRIKKHGLLIADNALWSGEVTNPKNADETTRGIIEFNRLISSSPHFISSILPIRDGVAVCLKI